MSAHRHIGGIDLVDIAHCMQRDGGGFAQAIGLALQRADLQNRERLLDAFDDAPGSLIDNYRQRLIAEKTRKKS